MLKPHLSFFPKVTGHLQRISRAMSVFSSERLQNKTALITGASAGIGRATALLFAKAGANVIIAARRQEALSEVLESLKQVHGQSGLQFGGKFAAVQMDVSDRADVQSLWTKVPPELRQVDILVNNAGFVKGVEKVGEISDEDIDSMIATNVIGLISVTQLLVKDFKSRGSGHVINIGSVAGREPYAGGSIYCSTKHAVKAFTGSLLRELVDTNIRVTEIQPGMVETEFSQIRYRGDLTAAKKVYSGLQPLTAEDIAEEIVWAAARPAHVNLAEVYVLPTAVAVIHLAPTMTDLFDADEEVESVLFVHREISVYRVPPLASMDGYKAADWGLDQPLWKGRMRILEKESSGVLIVLEDGQTGAPFARAPYTDEGAVQAALDSSRYFVLRVQDSATGAKAHIGIGFTDRTESLDFKIALQDYEKRKNPPAKVETEATNSNVPKKDYSLKDGQTFKISIPGGRFSSSSTTKGDTTSSSTASAGAIPLLPPPPSVRKK